MRKGADVCRNHPCNLGIFGLWKRQKAAGQHEEYPKENGRNPGEKRYVINELGVGYRMLDDSEVVADVFL